MLCSECRKEVKPVVVFDIDGTLGMYHDHFRQFAQGYFGTLMSSRYDGSTEFHEWLDLDLKDYRAAKLAYRQGGLKRTMPTYPYATGAVHQARDAGAEVWIATTRPYNRLDNIDPDTVEWCRRSGIVFDGLLYGDDKYAQLAEHVDNDRIVRIYEDLPEQREIAESYFPQKCVMVTRTHNLHHRKQFERTSHVELDIVAESIGFFVQQWKAYNGS